MQNYSWTRLSTVNHRRSFPIFFRGRAAVHRLQNGQNVQIEKPHISDLNMKNMGGVERADQLRSSYTVGRQLRKWYRYIFWFAFNVAACNADIWECKHQLRNHQRTRPQADFLLELGKRLINGYAYRNEMSKSPQSKWVTFRTPLNRVMCLC